MTVDELSIQIRELVDDAILDIPGELEAMEVASEALGDVRTGYEMRREELCEAD